MIPLACPRCHTVFTPNSERLTCAKCGLEAPVLRGVPRFVEEDPFYLNTGRWSKPDESAGGLRNLLVRKQRFFVWRLAGRRGTLLDLGCGGGWRLFARKREVAGLDISQRSLEAARTIYSTAVAASWTSFPFPDNTFDTIVSSDVLGHVPFEDKPAVFSEMYRVLKPGGRAIHYIEAEGNDPVTNFNKQYPDLYQQHFIDPEGHIGMERPSEIFDRFRREGFRPVIEQGAYKVLVYIPRVLQLYDNDYRKHSKLRDAWARGARALMKNGATAALGNLAMSAGIEIGDRVLPADWGSGVLVEYAK